MAKKNSRASIGESTDAFFNHGQFFDKDGNPIRMPDFADGETAPEPLQPDPDGEEMSFEEFQQAFENPDDVEIRDLGVAHGADYKPA